MSELLAVSKGTDGTTLVPPELFWLGRIPWASARLNWPAIVGDATRANPSAISAGVVKGTGAAAVVAAKADADIANAVSPAHRIVIEVIVRYRLARPQSAPCHRSAVRRVGLDLDEGLGNLSDRPPGLAWMPSTPDGDA